MIAACAEITKICTDDRRFTNKTSRASALLLGASALVNACRIYHQESTPTAAQIPGCGVWIALAMLDTSIRFEGWQACVSSSVKSRNAYSAKPSMDLHS